MKKRYVLVAALCLGLLAACGPAPAAEPTQVPPTATSPPTEAPPTATPIPPTETPIPPTETPLPPTPTPDFTQPFRDDFEGGLAEGAGWQWMNEGPDRWSVSDEGWLVVQADNPPFGSGEMVNLLARPIPTDRDIIITTTVRADAAENFKQAALFLLDENRNYVSILIGFCELCVPASGGYGLFMEANANEQNLLPDNVFIPRDAAQTEVILRLEYSPEAAVAVGLYAFTPGEWQTAAIVRDVPAFTMAGLGASNLPSPSGSTYDLTAEYDYFEMELP